jgi:hypothetical protein
MQDSMAAPNQDQIFYEKFKKDYFPSFDFFRLFFAILSAKKIIIIDTKKLNQFLFDAKEKHTYDALLKDIHFYFNGINFISKDIEPNINSLQTLGVLGRSNPKYENIINYFGTELSKKVISQYSAYNEEMSSLVDDFIKTI